MNTMLKRSGLQFNVKLWVVREYTVYLPTVQTIDDKTS